MLQIIKAKTIPRFIMLSDHLLDIPAKSPQPQIWGLEVFFVQLVEDAVHLVVVDDADDGIVQGRPGMGAVVWFARVAAVTLDFIPFSETFYAIVVERGSYLVVICLVICYEYCFHD